jgi:hypothetical protein
MRPRIWMGTNGLSRLEKGFVVCGASAQAADGILVAPQIFGRARVAAHPAANAVPSFGHRRTPKPKSVPAARAASSTWNFFRFVNQYFEIYDVHLRLKKKIET